MTIVSGVRVLEFKDVAGLAPNVPEEFVKLAYDKYTVWPRLKAGYRAVAFRRPRVGEMCIGTDSAGNVFTVQRDYDFWTPRVIVEKLPGLKRVVFTPVVDEVSGEQVVRAPKTGEWFLYDNASYAQAYSNYQGVQYPIFVRTLEEV